PQFTARSFTRHVRELELTHHRIPPRTPNHNAVCERLMGTVLPASNRLKFHPGRVQVLDPRDTSLDAAINEHNHDRPIHSDYMKGRTPNQVRDELLARIRQTVA